MAKGWSDMIFQQIATSSPNTFNYRYRMTAYW